MSQSDPGVPRSEKREPGAEAYIEGISRMSCVVGNVQDLAHLSFSDSQCDQQQVPMST